MIYGVRIIKGCLELLRVIFKSVIFAMYNVDSILLSSYVVWRKDLLIHTMRLDGFILPGLFGIPAGIYIGIEVRTEFFPLGYTDMGKLLNV